MKFLRVSLVGELSGPAIPDLILLLGNSASIKRIRNCYSQLLPNKEDLLKVIANGLRLKIIKLIFDEKEINLDRIVDILKVDKSIIEEHINLLKQKNIVLEIEKKYVLNNKILNELSIDLADINKISSVLIK